MRVRSRRLTCTRTLPSRFTGRFCQRRAARARRADRANASVLVDRCGGELSCRQCARRSSRARSGRALTAWSLADDGSISAVGGAWDADRQTYTFDVVSGVTAIARFRFTGGSPAAGTTARRRMPTKRPLRRNDADDAFAPDATMTRAMLVSVLWRLRGEPAPKAPNTFVDVPDGAWWPPTRSPGLKTEVVSGIGGRFDPDGFVTRADGRDPS